jgi:hypothetical protein
MLSTVQIAIIILVVVNILATIYFNYHRQEDYARQPNYQIESNFPDWRAGSTLSQNVNLTLQNVYKKGGGKAQEWNDNKMGGYSPTQYIGKVMNPLTQPLITIDDYGRKNTNTWGVCVNAACPAECGPKGSYLKCKTCLQARC